MMCLKFVIASVLICLSLSALAESESLGRLFTTPAERARLNLARKQGGMQAELAAPGALAPLVEQATLNGYVTRSSGKTTTWINTLPYNDNAIPGSLQVWQQPNHAPAISIQTDAGQRVGVKVGETVDMKTGDVRKLYQPMPNKP